LAQFSKISNGRDYYAHGCVKHYARNRCAFLCADATRRVHVAQRSELHLSAEGEKTEVAVSSHTDGVVNDPRMRSPMLEGTIDKGESVNPLGDYDGN
jgi:hypothetical protein